jgi:hypothetical protein
MGYHDTFGSLMRARIKEGEFKISNGMSFEKKIASHFYLGRRNASMQWTWRLWNRLVPDWMQPTKLMKQGGVSLRRKTKTYYGQKE